MHQHARAAAVQTPGGVAGQFAAHQALLVALCTQQAGAGGGGAIAAAAGGGSSVNEASSFATAVDQGHKRLAEMRQEHQVHPNMESILSIQTCNQGKLESQPTMTRLSLGCLILVRSLI